MGIQVTVTGGTAVDDRIPELLGRKWHLDQMSSTVLSFCKHLRSLSGKEHLGYGGLQRVQEGEVPEGLSQKLAAWNGRVTDWSPYQSSVQLSTVRSESRCTLRLRQSPVEM